MKRFRNESSQNLFNNLYVDFRLNPLIRFSPQASATPNTTSVELGRTWSRWAVSLQFICRLALNHRSFAVRTAISRTARRWKSMACMKKVSLSPWRVFILSLLSLFVEALGPLCDLTWESQLDCLFSNPALFLTFLFACLSALNI